MNRLRTLIVVATAGLVSATSANVARSAEEYERFLNALRARGYYDAALDYLTVMRTSPLLSADQQMMVPFEEARTYLEASRTERDNAVREKMLDGARDKFKEFADRNSAHALAAGATTQLGAVLVERGRAKLEQGLAPQNAANRAQIMNEARAYFEEAEKVFEEAEKKFEEKLGSFPKFIPQGDPQVAERETVKGDLIQAHMFHAYGLYEKSRTYDPKNEKEKASWEKALRTAAEKNGQIYRDYRTLIAGLAARLKEGQCYQELKDLKRAVGLYNDLLGQPDSLTALRPYKAGAMYMSLQCWTDDSERMFALAHTQGDEFLRGSSTNELQNPEWLAVRFFTAVAHKKRYEELVEPKGEEVKEKEHCYNQARDHAQIVAKTPGEYQSAARGLLNELLGGEGRSDAEPKTFLEANTRAVEAMQNYEAANAEAGKADATPEVKTAKAAEADEERKKAIDLFNKALSLKTVDTASEDVNTARYCLGYLAFTQGKLYDAAVVGEFLMKYYPNSGNARSAALISLASYVTEYQAAKKQFGEVAAAFDRLKVDEVASKITKQWEGKHEADVAWNIKMQLAVAEENREDVVEALNHIQESSPLRAEAEMQAGMALWNTYRRQLGMDEGAPDKMAPADVQALTVAANGVLESAIERQRLLIASPDKLTLQQAQTQLDLCDSRIALGQYAKALEGLEDPQIGLLALVRAADKNPSATAGSVPLETYKLALQAYVLNDQADKAQALIPELDALPGAGAGGDTKTQLANTYLNLALTLSKQIDQQRAAGNLAALKQAAKGFSFFLAQIEASAESFDPQARFQNLNWVSDNYYRLGNDLIEQPSVSSEDRTAANAYFAKSSALDDKLAPMTEAGSNAQLIVKLRKARAMRRAEMYAEAVTALQEVLAGKRNLMEAQTEACETLMERAAQKKEPHVYTYAVNGSRPDEKGDNIIWGWARIGKTMQQSPYFGKPVEPMMPGEGAPAESTEQYQKDLAKYQEDLASHKTFINIFHQARYNMALCYYRQALAQDVKDERDKGLKAADYALTITEQYAPDLGGDEWKPKYEELRKKVQSALQS